MATLIQILANALNEKDPLLAAETRRIILKEVLHAYVLNYLYNHAFYRRLNFFGVECAGVITSFERGVTSHSGDQPA